MERRARRPSRRLLLRIFAFGAALLAVSAAAFLLLQAFVFGSPNDGNRERVFPLLGEYACERVAVAKDRPVDLSDFVTLTVYRGDGTIVASSAVPPHPPLAPDRIAELEARGSMRAPTLAVACRDVEPFTYVVFARSPGPPFPFRHVALIVALVALAMAIASVPFARSISRPLERLIEVTRALGEGDLAARAEVGDDDIGELAGALNEMAERLDRLIRAEKEMLANISHELRTPLARIRVVIDSARENPKRAEALLTEIGRDLADLERLVNEVMTSVRLEVGSAPRSGPLPVQLEPTDLGALLKKARDHFVTATPSRAVDLVIRKLPPVLADARLLRRVVDNLLDNAHKYSDAGAPIIVSAEDCDGFVRVSVEDKGAGIDPEDVANLGVPFFRTDRSRSRNSGGMGLGLALAKKIIEAHHGNLDIKSEPQVGTTVSFALASAESPS